MQAYSAYYEKGRIIPIGNPIIPEGRRIIITVLDEPSQEVSTAKNTHAEAWREFLNDIKNIKDEPLSEFERVKFREKEI